MSNANDRTSKGYMKDLEEAAGVKKDSTTCKQSPFALDGQHVYEIEGKCIYCGRYDPDKKEGAHVPRPKEVPHPKCPGRSPFDSVGMQVLIGAFEMYGSIVAMQARMDGMKARNMRDHLNGSFSQYNQEDFDGLADSIEIYVKQLQVLARLH